MYQKLISLGIIVSALVGFSSCGLAKDDVVSDGERLTVMTIDFNAGKSNTGAYATEVLRRINEYCNANLSIEWVLNDNMSDKAASYLNAPESMPMIMTWGGTVTGNVVRAAKSDAFVDLNDYIWDEEKYPNLSKMNKDVAESLMVDGKLIAIPRSRVIGRYGLCYRTDWAEKLGLDAPDTPEKVYEMLYAFTYGDPDGNGKDDTVGMEMTKYTGTFDIIQTWFGCGNGWAVSGEGLIPVHMQPEYMEALDYIKKLYDDGLMPKDFAARSTDTWSDGCKTGKNGVFIDVLDSGRRIWDYFVNEDTFVPSVTDPSQPASMTLFGSVNGHTLATSGYNGFFTLSKSSCDTEEKIDMALRFLDRLCEDEMLILTQYGLEGIHYDIVDGYIVKTENVDPSFFNDFAGLNQLLCYLPSAEHVTEPHVEDSERLTLQNETYKKTASQAVVNPASNFLINSSAYAETGEKLEEKINDARIRYICGEINKEELQAIHDEWFNMGGYLIIKEVNEQYKANH